LFSPVRSIANQDLNPDQPGLSTCVPQRILGGSSLENPASDSVDTWSPDVFDLESLDFGQVHHGAFSGRPAADHTMAGGATAYGLRDVNTMDPICSTHLASTGWRAANLRQMIKPLGQVSKPELLRIRGV
jgi:hypothetical protein